MRRISLGYAYINFNNHHYQDSNTSLEALNFTPINGKPIRIMYSHRDPSIRKSGQANIFIKNLDSSIDNKALFETFVSFGIVLYCKVATDNHTGQSKGYGFVQFERDESAQDAINSLDGMLLNDKQVYVGIFVRRQERDLENGSPKFTNVYVKNLSESTTDDDLSKVFGTYGQVTSAVIMRDASGNSRGFGFVNFQNPDDAAAAFQKLNGRTFNDDKVWFVGRAQRKYEREAELKAKFEQEGSDAAEKLQGSNIYLKNLGDTINDENLKELFSEFGCITSCKVMLDPHVQSRGSGQGGPGLVPQPAAYGFQPQLFPGMRPGVSPNFMMPYPLQLRVAWAKNGCQESWDPTASDSTTSSIVVFFHMFCLLKYLKKIAEKMGGASGAELKNWCLPAVLEEYQRFAGPKAMPTDMIFIENYGTSRLSQCLYRIIYLYVSNSCHSVYQEESV
ncbi:hypothetical protein MKX03_013465 [Papaver bracteatum]|nr:hypothetical protein MKX03_013465 [Papaver bracteatum]